MKTHLTPLATFVASRLGSTGKSLASAGLAALLLAAGSMPASAQAPFGVVNGGFETGNFSGWTLGGTGGTNITGQAHSGNFAANFPQVGTPGTLSQNVRTFAGGSYTLTYFLGNNGGPVNFFSTQFNGATLSSINNAPAQPYTRYTFTGLQTNSASTPLVFSAFQNPSSWVLDDISLTLNNLTNSTTLFLGPGTAVLPITNNFTQTSKGVLQIQVGGLAPGQHDLIMVGGNAKLDGKLQLLRLNGFSFHRGDEITILTAGGKVSGEFASFASNFGNNILSPIAIYNSDSVVLEVSTFARFASTFNLSPNQLSVARALDRVVYDTRETSLINYLDNRSLNKLPDDFVRIAPTDLTSIFAIGNSLATVQSLNIQRRADDIRSGSSGFSAAGLALNGSGPSYSGGFNITTGVAGPSGDDGKEVKETKQVVPAENRWGAFLSGTGEWVSVGDTNNARGYDLESGGFTLGVDYKLTPNLAVGLAGGYTGTTADLTKGGRVYVNGGKIGLYGTFFQNEQPTPMMSKDSSKDSSKEAPAPAPAPSVAKGFYADAAVFGGYNSFDTHRFALQGDARGSTDGGEFDGLFGVGYDFKKGGLTFGPTGSFNYTYLGTNSFTETGSLAPLNIHGAQNTSLRSAFGLKASYDIKAGRILIRPELRAAWQHEYGDAAASLDSDFANGGGNTFRVSGPQIGRDSALLGAGFAIQCSERCSTYFYYDGELGRKNYQATNVTGGFRYSF